MNDLNQTVDDPGRESGPPAPAVSTRTHIGRYRVERVLGRGGFGLVYLAHDDQLQRLVAIKVPHGERLARPEDADAYLTEARTVASLDHPHIVPVYDVGSAPDCPGFVVSKYIDGSDLFRRLKQARLALHEAVELVATVAEALHHAHKHGFVHRDIKPGNILLDKAGKPYVADFGLALREQDVGLGPRYAGTTAYMSPEQARGEGHRVDGRSDIFSLGVVFYELLTGQQPFRADAKAALLEQVTTFEPRPPRQFDDGIPKELDRICLKALSKRASERYSAARDMAEDLRHFLADQTVDRLSDSAAKGSAARPVPAMTGGLPTQPPWTSLVSTSLVSGRSSASWATAPTSDSQPLKIVPKGLRSFDAHDADFFLELLPGPRDRDGLPDSIRFWKTRIEATDADSTFSVGLIYGPSGCGKSSLVKAGLLPRLAKPVTAVYVEATGAETEARLKRGLRRQIPDLPDNLGFSEALAALRRGRYLEPGRKVLLVLDQFEQWLHAQRNDDNPELVRALRQCDGGRLQAVVMVRDDFWLAVSRFLKELEVRLVEGQNSALVDLFDVDHARKVLAAFGRALGKLPENNRHLSNEQKAFLDHAAAELAQEGKVVCVRLALFAEMLKGKPWTAATLKEAGGTEGVGIRFLEETFSSPTAPPEHRYHQTAARAVLQTLLPEAGTDIKGHMRSQKELLAASGYGKRPSEFEALARILDSELRLITPSDPEGLQISDRRWQIGPPEADDDRESMSVPEQSAFINLPSAMYYQLTHDYLVPSLRDWLTRKQKETRRGRAQLLLADRAAVWNVRPENRQLPALFPWLRIRLLTTKKSWSNPERKMMRRAMRYHGVRGLAALLILLLAGWASYELHGRFKARALADTLLSADTGALLETLKEIGPYRPWLDPLLRDAYQEAERQQQATKQLHASLALLPVDSAQADYLHGRLLTAQRQEALAILQMLSKHKQGLPERMWRELEKNKDASRRLRAAAALAVFAPADERWPKFAADAAAVLVAQNPLVLETWVEALQPVRDHLLPPLAGFLEDDRRSPADRRTIAGIYAKYASGRTEVFARLEARLQAAELSKIGQLPRGERARALKARAHIASALLAMGRAQKVWPLLKHARDPGLRSFLIEDVAGVGAEPRMLLDQLALLGRMENPSYYHDTSIRRALILTLGGLSAERWPIAERQAEVSRFVQLYEDDADPGIRAAAEWLLRGWKQERLLEQADKGLMTGTPQGQRRWYVNRQGQTLVILPGSGKENIGASFAIASKEVTQAQFRKCPAFKDHTSFNPGSNNPAVNVSWYQAAEYCNWLSAQEGIPRKEWCYLPNQAGQYAAGMKIAADFLKHKGYRLATEAEWEQACAAGAVTVFPWGDFEELVGGYGWHYLNSSMLSQPVAMLKPNDFGLFDMQGNAWEWCQDVLAITPVAPAKAAKEDHAVHVVVDQHPRVFRGGGFGSSLRGSFVSGVPTSYPPAVRDFSIGFRVARTFIAE